MQIYCNWVVDDDDVVSGGDSTPHRKDYTLATLPERRFDSVADAVNHCANVGIYCRQFPPVVLKYPLAEEPL